MASDKLKVIGKNVVSQPSIHVDSAVRMKGFLYIVCLFLSLPNLIIGLALLVLRHSFATWHPLEIITSFLFQMVWGLPLAASLFVILLVCGIVSATRPYAAMFALILNGAALGLVLFRFGPPRDFDEAVFCLPIFAALIGFAWLGYPVCQRRSR